MLPAPHDGSFSTRQRRRRRWLRRGWRGWRRDLAARAIGCALLLLAALACGSRVQPQETLDAMFRRTQTEFRDGDQDRAFRSADAGLQASAERQDPFFEIRFRFVKVEILLLRRDTEHALRLLAEPIPDSARFKPLKARWVLLDARAER